MAELDGKVAVVVGAGPGVGRAGAVAYARAGATVVVAARRAEPLTELAEAVAAETGAVVHAVPVDLADRASCRALIATVTDRCGGVDAVVNVATSSGSTSIDDADLDDWHQAFEVNVLGTLEVSRSAARSMATRGGGAIVQVSSLGAHSRPARLARYTATKAAMVSASFTLAKEVGRHNVRVNVVTPGYITGDHLDAMFARAAEHRGTTVEAISAEFARPAALRRHVTPEEIADAVVFLSGPRAAAITGVELPVTAGHLI